MPTPTDGSALATDQTADITDYDSDDLSRILGEAAHVLRTIGFAGGGLTIIGGLMSTLRVPMAASVRHDIDFFYTAGGLPDVCIDQRQVQED